MMPVISFWLEGQAPVELSFDLPGSPQLHIYSLSKKISNDQELIQSDPISCPQNQKGNN